MPAEIERAPANAHPARGSADDSRAVALLARDEERDDGQSAGIAG